MTAVVLGAAGCVTQSTSWGPSILRVKGDEGDPSAELDKVLTEWQEHPGDPQYPFKAARLCEAMGDIQGACYYCGRVVALTPPGQYTGPYYELGRVCALMNRFDEARQALEACLAVPPAEPDGQKQNPHYRAAAWLLASIHDARGEASRSDEYLDLYVRYGGDAGTAARRKARGVAVAGVAAATATTKNSSSSAVSEGSR